MKDTPPDSSFFGMLIFNVSLLSLFLLSLVLCLFDAEKPLPRELYVLTLSKHVYILNLFSFIYYRDVSTIRQSLQPQWKVIFLVSLSFLWWLATYTGTEIFVRFLFGFCRLSNKTKSHTNQRVCSKCCWTIELVIDTIASTLSPVTICFSHSGAWIRYGCVVLCRLYVSKIRLNSNFGGGFFKRKNFLIRKKMIIFIGYAQNVYRIENSFEIYRLFGNDFLGSRNNYHCTNLVVW